MAKQLLLFMLLAIVPSPGTAYICSNDDSSPRDDFQNHTCFCGTTEISPLGEFGEDYGDLYATYNKHIYGCYENESDNTSIECAFIHGSSHNVRGRTPLTEIPVVPGAAHIYSEMTCL